MRLFIIILSMLLIQLNAKAQSDPDAFLRGEALMQEKLPQKAIDEFTKSIQNGNRDAQVYLSRGRAYMANNQYTLAIEDFLRADSLKENIASFELSRAYAFSGDKSKAVMTLKDHLASVYRKPVSIIKLDPAFASLERNREWLHLWDSTWYSPEEESAARINYLLNSKRYIDAIELAGNEIDKNPSKHIFYYLRGKAFQEYGNPGNALKDYSKAVDKFAREADYYIARASVYRNDHKFREAAEDMKRAVRLRPEDPSLLKILAVDYINAGNKEEGVEAMNKYAALFRENTEAVYQAGMINYEAGKYVKALEFFNQNLKNNQTDPRFFKARGDTYYQTRLYRYAIRDYGMALDLNPDLTDVWYMKGLARYQAGDHEGACIDWSRARRKGDARAAEKLKQYCGK